MRDLPAFDCEALFDALDVKRRALDIGWYDLAAQLWEQSTVLNLQLDDHPLCGGAIQRLPTRGATSCQYALFMLRWLGRAPEDFLVGRVVDVGDTTLPQAQAHQRLRWDLSELHRDLNAARTGAALTWASLGQEIGCTPARLTNLKTARLADMGLAMRLTQWLEKPAAAYVHPSAW